ncbi:LPS export ABC transporter periplasmic protein LptC [Piscinibacter koreensis]|uniref:LPS export ABC transporter periplasmic protein LptC n=1 Tax=Piscinibacter koreensis TaxID=2742824 RepID=A0A7Y6NJM6_9BURK|nr:LPS export ABC transporter periplasmic protein LptC [Schlegelella koreensis]NUZ04405.1 LPS export ABC transporter periplasmic protein LptC [Schlegelella koreensis]
MERADPALDDTAGIDLSFAGPPVAPALPWHQRALDVASAYLPLILMAALAGATWWLVTQAPSLDGPAGPAAPRHEPDYTMTTFMIQRFGPDGALRTQIEGDRLRHYPDTDTLEIDNPRFRAIAADGNVTLASAKRALSNGDGSEVQLFDDAKVTRNGKGPNDPPLEFRSEFLHAFRNIERVRSNRPVTVTQGDSRVQADAMEYDNLTQTVDLKGRTRALFESRGGGVSR